MIKNYILYDLVDKTIISKEMSAKDFIDMMYDLTILTTEIVKIPITVMDKTTGDKKIVRFEEKCRKKQLVGFLESRGCLCFDEKGETLDYPVSGYFTRYILIDIKRNDIPKIVQVKIKYGKFRKLRLNKLLKYFEEEDKNCENLNE